MRAWTWGLIVAGVAAAGAGTWYATRPKKVDPVEVVAAKVHRTTIVRRIRGVGHVNPVTQVNVSANVSGDLLALHVKEGDVVKRGALLAEVDRERIQAAVRQAEANARSVEADVTLQEARLAQVQADLRRTEGLHVQKLATDAELERIKNEQNVSQATIEGARQRVEQARAALDEARARLQQTRLIAPIDGTVIALEKKVGERIRGSDLAEDRLLTLAPLHAMEVEVEVSEQDVVSVTPGLAAEIEVDALGLDAPKIPGVVSEIASSAVIKNRGTEMETTSFRVKVALDTIPARLRSGMSAAVAIAAESKSNVLAIPIECVTARMPHELALHGEEARKAIEEKAKRIKKDESSAGEMAQIVQRREKPVRIVFTVAGELAEPKKVDTGIASDTELEVVSGLADGEQVIAGPYRVLAKDLYPGAPVKVVDSIRTSSSSEPSKAVADKKGS